MQKCQYLMMIDRIDSFLSNPGARVLRGERRMGPESLLDVLAERIAEDHSANVIYVKEKNNFLESIRSDMAPGKVNHIILYADLDLAESDLIIKTFPDAKVYRAGEICHQVPICFREPVPDDICSCELH
ncbi:MAG: hypothetical protein FWC29_05640 [Methanomassiliicoccaceae archaeon]|nr:hypothetical protein [Methanomassiliicoccaceae archaeon]